MTCRVCMERKNFENLLQLVLPDGRPLRDILWYDWPDEDLQTLTMDVAAPCRTTCPEYMFGLRVRVTVKLEDYPFNPPKATAAFATNDGRCRSVTSVCREIKPEMFACNTLGSGYSADGTVELRVETVSNDLEK